MAWCQPDLPAELRWAGPRQDPWRFALALLAIALGVALGHAILLINSQASAEFSRAAQDLTGDANLVVRGAREGFDEAVFAKLAVLEDIDSISPSLEMEVRRTGSPEGLRLLAVDAFRAAQVQPALVPVAADDEDHLALLRPGRIFVNARAQANWNLRIGDEVGVQTGMQTRALRVAGTLPSGTEAPLAVMDLGAAQQLFVRIGRINRIDVKLRDGVDAEAARARIAARLPPGVHVLTAAQSDASARRVTRAYRVNLAVLALVALFTGALMVLAMQSLSVRRRTTQHAIWRALGVSRSQLRAVLLGEAAWTGLAGGLAGVIAGELLARLFVQWMQGDTGVQSAPGASAGLAFSPLIAAAMIACGVLAALAGAWTAAASAARLPVARALRSQDAWQWDDVRHHFRIGVAALGAGSLLCLAPPVDGLPLYGYLAIAALLLGTLLLLPGFAQALLRQVPMAAPLALSLPAAQLRGAMAQVSLSLAATVAAVSLSVAMAIMVASFRDSLDVWLDRVLPAALYIRAGQPNDSAFIDSVTQRAIVALPGVQRVQFQRSQQVALSAERARVSLLARDLVDANAASALPLVGEPLRAMPAGTEPVWVSEIAATLHSLRLGDHFDLPLDGRLVPCVVVGVWRDYVRQQGALLMDRARYIALSGDHRVNEAALWLAPGAGADDTTQALSALVGGDMLEVASAQALRTRSLALFDRTFAVTYALEAVAIFIGLLGLSSSVGALVLSRRREFGVLRHLGFTPGTIRRLLAVEGALTTGTGIIVGLSLGVAMSWILIHIVNRQSFHWGMDLLMPWAGLAGFAASLLILATLASWWSARQAVGADLVLTVKQDW